MQKIIWHETNSVGLRLGGGGVSALESPRGRSLHRARNNLFLTKCSGEPPLHARGLALWWISSGGGVSVWNHPETGVSAAPGTKLLHTKYSGEHPPHVWDKLTHSSDRKAGDSVRWGQSLLPCSDMQHLELRSVLSTHRWQPTQNRKTYHSSPWNYSFDLLALRGRRPCCMTIMICTLDTRLDTFKCCRQTPQNIRRHKHVLSISPFL